MQEERLHNLKSTIRACSALETLNNLTSKLKLLGITRVARVTGLDNIGVPVSIAIRPNARHLSTAQGKGSSAELADISAIMESVESYHMEHPPQPKYSGSFVQLSKQAIAVLNPKMFDSGFFIPKQLEMKELKWVEATNLASREKTFLPQALVSFDSTKPFQNQSYFKVNSNGLAAGNSIDEAVFYGLLELIERDSYEKWAKLSEEQKLRTEVCLSSLSFESASILKILGGLNKANASCRIWDITSGLGVPSFRCVISNRQPLRKLGDFAGTGAHLLKEIALTRAVTEAAQSRLTSIVGSRDDIDPSYYQRRRQEDIADDNLNQKKKKYNDCIDGDMESSFNACVARVLSILEKQSIYNVYYVDHTKLEIGIAVAQCFCPMLSYSGKRYG